jgi:lysozyme
MRSTSQNGLKMLTDHEGVVLTAYLDPVGIPTIGTGFTNRSKIATAMIGKIVPGKTKITLQQNNKILAEVLQKEYEPPVERKWPPQYPFNQEKFDAQVSAVYNLGSGFMNWRWFDLWVNEGASKAANYWRNNYNTAKGKKLPGLVRRRKEEADLFEYGRYPHGYKASKTIDPRPDEEVKEAQEKLKKLGHNPGAIDGIMGPKTKAAVLAYQKFHPHLVNDGILGPATIAQLKRDIDAAKDFVTKGSGAAAVTTVTGVVAGLSWQTIIVVALVGIVIGVLYAGWRYRDILKRRWNKIFGKVVEV